MITFLFTCPKTSMKVQHWLADDADGLEADFEGAECNACGSVHFVNRKGEVFGAEDKD